MLTIDNDREQAVKQRLKPLVPCGDDLVEHLHNTAHKTPAHKTQTLHKAPAHKTPAQHSTYNICTIQYS